MEYVTCNLCGGDRTAPLYTLQDWFLNRPGVEYTLVKCLDCGLIYQNPRPSLEEMQAHYPPDYESYAADPPASVASSPLGWALEYGVRKRTRFVTRHKRQGRLLDVGCASGSFLKGMQSVGTWELFGVELNEYAAQMARGQNLDVRTGTLEQAAFPDKFFDAVTLWDVLEHLPDPQAALREVHRILKTDGLLLIRVPNARSWDAAVFGRYWAGLDAPRHLYVFTPRTLAALLRKCDYQVDSWTTRTGAYTESLLSLRFWMAATGRNKRDAWIVDRLYHPATRVLAAPFFYLSALGLKGPLMMVTAKQPARSV